MAGSTAPADSAAEPVIERVISSWGGHAGTDPALIDELRQLYEDSPEAAASLAAAIFPELVELGESVPDMSWVHVAVLCSDLLVYGLTP